MERAVGFYFEKYHPPPATSHFSNEKENCINKHFFIIEPIKNLLTVKLININ